jgi:hypothetical protein
MAYPAFRPTGLYYCFFGNDPYGTGYPANASIYDPIGGWAPMGNAGLAGMAVGTYVDPTHLTCVAPPYFGPTNGPVAVVIVDQNPTGLLPGPGEGQLLNVAFYQAAAWTWRQPTIVSISPTSGGAVGGTSITLTGTDLYQTTSQFTNYLVFNHVDRVPLTYVNPTTLTGVSPPYADGPTTVDVTLEPPIWTYGGWRQASTTLVNAWTYTPVWWLTYDLVLEYGDYILPAPSPVWVFDEKPPKGKWTAPGASPDPNGWWSSTSDFRGDVTVVAGVLGDNAIRPKDPRTWTDLHDFAAISAAMLGGSPGIAVSFHNRLVYAATGYAHGTAAPPIRIFDGSYDRELTTIPPPSSGGVATAIVSILVANGRIYLSTLDQGNSSSTFVGRVFMLDIESAALTPIGAPFPVGHVPYALAWCNGFLYCGTHRQAPVAGKIFAIRPDIDTAWVADYDLATAGAGLAGVAALRSFQGALYVGTTAAAGTFATILKRSPSGTYTTAVIAGGGAATDNNGYLSLMEFQGQLYASYWNHDTPAIAVIQRTPDGAAWTTSYTGSAGTLRPFIVLGVDDGQLFAIGGGLDLAVALLSTTDGVTWTDLTPQIPDTTETALPAFGVVVL